MPQISFPDTAESLTVSTAFCSTRLSCTISHDFISDELQSYGTESPPKTFLQVDMSIEKHIDGMIKAAIDRGEFKNLEGEGKPIDLEAYFATPEDVRMGYSVLKSNDLVPEEIDRLKEIAELRTTLKTCSEEERPKILKLLRDKELALSLILDRNKRRK
ncbi:MAG TPA: hypothetical protein DEA22_11800 [Blastocatellia bacterium]|nr:hypothetical protein [Blastocatellia bacterium]